MATPARPAQSASANPTPATVGPDQRRDIEELTDRLSDRLDDAIPGETIRAQVCRQYEVFQHVAIRQFVPVFVERRVRAELGS